jgi:hypothetical protein
MTEGENTVELSINPRLAGGISLSVDEVTFTTYMELPPKL